MRLVRLFPFACFALVLVFAASAVNLTAPGVIVRAAESAPDEDDDEDREREPATAVRQAPHDERPALRTRSHTNFPPVRSAARAATGVPAVPADPLGSRLRC